MLTFKQTMDGYEVLVDGKQFGWISKRGFFTDSTAVKEFLQVSSAQLREIAEKASLVQHYGHIPTCCTQH